MADFAVDIDECARNQDRCHDNAACVNNDGGYTCQCKKGYRGDGFICDRKLVLFSFLLPMTVNSIEVVCSMFLLCIRSRRLAYK